MYLETDRLIIRDFEEADLDGVHVWRSDPEVARFMNFEPASKSESQAFLVSCITHNRQEPRESYSCAILRKEAGMAIGWIGWGGASPEKREVGDFDFGYALRRDAWGNGYGPETIRAVIDFCLTELDVETLFGETDVGNARSARAMQKAGMEPMGVAPWDDTSLWFLARKAPGSP